jgi:penicillin amidase
MNTTALPPVVDDYQRRQSETIASLSDMARRSMPLLDGMVTTHGIESAIEILRDKWGVPHIYAKSTRDLFFAQGYVAAQDRLYQMEMWRRSATGELSEILGRAYIERDRLARLMQYRGDKDTEWNSYGEEHRLILDAFTQGINAYIEKCGNDLPVEFQLLNFRPRLWEPEDCLLRQFSPRIVSNTTQEIARSEMISQIGIDATMKFLPTDPYRFPVVDAEVDLSEISSDSFASLVSLPVRASPVPDGSNCWAVDGTLSATGKPLLASDPHRTMILPALRYMCHLVAPGWNVIGAGEPHLPGVAIGHNDRIAFGFAVAQFDQADLYVETLSPHDPGEYRHGQEWVKMRTETAEIKVKGGTEPVKATLKFTRHGPIVWESKVSNRAIAIRWTGAEPGTAAYLGCLKIDQAQDWQTFRNALEYWRMPAENMIYADVDNNIGWIAAGLLPIRKTWDGLLPVPGHSDGYEWEGFRSIGELPQEYNPACHFVANANNKIVSQDYPCPIGFDWKSPFRIERIRETLGQLEKITIKDFKRLQHDEYSIPARRLIDLLRQAPSSGQPHAAEARELLLSWNCVLASDSNSALLFKIWLTHIRSHLLRTYIDERQRSVVGKYLELPTLLGLLKSLPTESLDALLDEALESAFLETAARFGADKNLWRWGALHKVRFCHPLSDTELRRQFLDIGEFECGGDDETVNSTRGAKYACETGASHRQIIDLSDWDQSLFVNIPGQSGHPSSLHYRDLLKLWEKKEYAPLLYSRAAIEQNTIHRLTLLPAGE